MNRSKCGMWSLRSPIGLLATLYLVARASAGPLGPLPMHNLTAADMGLKEGSCALGDVVYMHGDEFPGSTPCERCRCQGGGVRCSTQACEPRPGCKALHRPDHCCPTYQCECEQEGRVYGNGEKLVDPEDPCRVCYCQGGEVVCRRIACFLRDDCTPRRVPGRCCPEYDNCPLRGVTSIPGLTSSPPSPAPGAEHSAPAVPAITIKEITPKSEIPVITEVKIKEILPSPSIEVAEYSSSKSPLITREATSQKTNADVTPKPDQEMPSVVEVHSFPETVNSDNSHTSTDSARVPSKISLSTQDSINSEIYPSPMIPIVATTGAPVTVNPLSTTSSTKAPVIDEEDPALFDHNPAFPPLPDDLSNHGEEIVQEPSIDSDHILEPQVIPLSITSAETLTTTHKNIPDFTETTVKPESPRTEPSSTSESTSTVASVVRENPITKLRSAIPSDTFSISSEESGVKKITFTKNVQTTTQTVMPQPKELTTVFSTTTEASTKIDTPTPSAETVGYEETTKSVEIEKYEDVINSEEYGKSQEIMKSEEINVAESSETEETATYQDVVTTPRPVLLIERVSFIPPNSDATDSQPITHKAPDATTASSETTPSTQEQSTNSVDKSNIATEVTSQTELLSSLPIETSDQNPHESSLTEAVSEDSSEGTPAAQTGPTTVKPTSSEPHAGSSEIRSIENVETTEFIITNFGSQESATDAVEVIKIPGDADRSAAIIDREMPFKSKSATVTKQKVIEIEDDDESSITDSPTPNDKAEPTTRRPIIDNVDDAMPATNPAGANKKDIEIIAQSYVPTINKRPTKVVLQEEEQTREVLQSGTSAETTAAPAPSAAESTTLATTPAPETTTLVPQTTAESTTPSAIRETTTWPPAVSASSTPAPAPAADRRGDSAEALL